MRRKGRHVIGVVMGSIYGGITGITEAAGMGAFAVLVIAILRGEASWDLIWDSLMRTLKSTGTIIWVTIGAAALAGAYTIAGGPTYVADFIGDVNIIEGNATVHGDTVSIAWAEGQPEIIGTAGEGLSAGNATFAIRPEKVAISAERPEGMNNVVQGRIHDIAYLGNISTYHVALSDGTLMKAQAANNRRLSRRSFTWEDEVWLSWTDTAGLVLAG